MDWLEAARSRMGEDKYGWLLHDWECLRLKVCCVIIMQVGWGFSLNIGPGSIEKAEFWGIAKGLELAWDQGWCMVILEYDIAVMDVIELEGFLLSPVIWINLIRIKRGI